MLKNYFIVALRNFWKRKIFSLINIAGLAIGISAALTIYLIVQYEYSFDQFHVNQDRIYRIVSKIDLSDRIVNTSGVPIPAVKAVRAEIPGLVQVTNFMMTYDIRVSVPLEGNKTPLIFKKQTNVVYADEYYFNVFQYKWLAGSGQTALMDPFQVVLTESRARTYFSNLSLDQIVGKTIVYDDSLKITVSGIVKDLEGNTDLVFKEFISKSTIEQTGLKSHWALEDWGTTNSNSQVFVLVSPGSKPADIEQQLVVMRNKYVSKGNQGKDNSLHLLQPLNDIHFNSDYGAFDNRLANKSILASLLAVALFLLLLGSINFINLTTAQSTFRAKEMGIRKTLGSDRFQLAFQILSETFIVTLLATLLSVALAPLFLTLFRDFIPPGVSFQSVSKPHVWLFLLALVVLVSLFSGLYPSWVITRFKPVTVLKNQLFDDQVQNRKSTLRKVLTVTQFVITQVLLMCTLVFSKQINYSLNKDLGYKKEAIVSFNTDWKIFSQEKDERRLILLDQMKAIPEIEHISLASSPPASNNTTTNSMKYTDGDRVVETIVEIKFADPEYFNLYGLKLLAGSQLLASDTIKQFIINETYSKLLGFKSPEEAVGKFIDRNKLVPIAGVVADFHTKSTHEPIKPLAFASSKLNSYKIHLALKPRGDDPGTWHRGLAKVEKLFKQIYPDDDFDYTFFDESLASFYTTERNLIQLLKWATGLCIFISCLGLLGLVIHTTNQRTKEIGVRKVLGATITQIVTLLSKDFILLVFISFVIASPMAWWGVHRWLASFEYRVNVGWIIFVLVGVCVFTMALITLSSQTIKAATANPVTSLRSE